MIYIFSLTEHQLDSRRRGLESYLERTCSIRVIVDHPAMREFLTDNESENATLPEVELKIMLPNQSCFTINIKRNQQTSEVLLILLQHLQIPTKLARHFGIFETVENTFGEIFIIISNCKENIFTKFECVIFFGCVETNIVSY